MNILIKKSKIQNLYKTIKHFIYLFRTIDKAMDIVKKYEAAISYLDKLE